MATAVRYGSGSDGIQRRLPETSLEHSGDTVHNSFGECAEYIKNVPSRKTDQKDAEWIAQLLQHGLLRPSYAPLRNHPRPKRLDQNAGESFPGSFAHQYQSSNSEGARRRKPGRAMLEDIIAVKMIRSTSPPSPWVIGA
jgi:hypothetical protein